ncbi:hypothetical protein GST85_28155 [Pseudomonas putida]
MRLSVRQSPGQPDEGAGARRRGRLAAARRLNQGKFHWPGIRHGSEVELDSEQLQALVLGLPWLRVGAGGVISML